MSKEREILKKILMLYREDKSCMSWGTANEIQQLLAQPEPFKPDWVNYQQGVEDAKREPINHDDILDRSINGSFEYRDGFMDGVMFAENHHGIGVGNE